MIVLIPPLIFPFAEARTRVRNTIGPKDFVETYRDSLLGIYEKRDMKGLYQKAWAE